MSKVNLGINIPISVLKEDKKFVVYSPALDLSTSGKTYNEAKKRFGEIVEIFFEELLKKNTLGEALKELGWKKIGSKLIPPVVISQEYQTIRVPAQV